MLLKEAMQKKKEDSEEQDKNGKEKERIEERKDEILVGNLIYVVKYSSW